MSSDKERLFDAVEEGSVDKLKSILRQSNVDINSKDEAEDTALHCAVRHRKRGVLEVLLGKGADVNSRNRLGYTPLMWALNADYTEEIEMLLSTKNTKLDAKSDDGETLLMAAIKSENYKIARLLLKSKKVDIDSQNEWGETALILAVTRCFVDIVRLLLQYGAIRSLKDNCGRTAQDVAARNLDVGIVNVEHSNRIMELFGTLPIVLEDEEISDTVQRESSPVLSTHDNDLFKGLDSLWTAVGSHKRGIPLDNISLSFMPKDKLDRYVDHVLGEMKDIMKGETDMKPLLSKSRRRPVSPDLRKQWVWVHVPSNNVCASSIYFR